MSRKFYHTDIGTIDDWVFIIISNLSNDRSKASCKTVPPHSAI